MPFGARIIFPYTNNEAEYEACILRLEEAVNIQIKTLDVYGDSALVINQTNREMVLCWNYVPRIDVSRSETNEESIWSESAPSGVSSR